MGFQSLTAMNLFSFSGKLNVEDTHVQAQLPTQTPHLTPL